MPSGNKARLAHYQSVVNTPFKDEIQAAKLGLGIVALLLVNKNNGVIDRLTLSETKQAEDAVKVSVKPLKEINIPVEDKTNIIAKAIRSRKFQKTDDWMYLFTPDLSAEEARLNQASAGIGSSVVYPLEIGGGGALVFSYFLAPTEITEQHHKFMQNFCNQAVIKLKSS